MTKYFCLDGPDGCGKSAQARRLVAWLQREGKDVAHVREPGSTPFGEDLRKLLLNPRAGNLHPLAEALVFSGARCEVLRKEIEPALARGAVVVAERCYLSTYVYQSMAIDDGVELDFLQKVTRAVHGKTMPDLTILLDVDAATGAERRSRRRHDRFEERGEAFQERVRQAFLKLSTKEPNVTVIDARRPLEDVSVDIQKAVGALLRGWRL